MQQLRIRLISLLFAFAFLFNIERLDLGAENILDIQSFVYVLAIFVTTVILFVPPFPRHRVTLSVAFTLVLYLVFKLLFLGSRPLVNGFDTYVAVTEVACLTVIAFTSQRLAHSLYAFQEGFEALALNVDKKPLQTISKASGDIRREITRSRHYHRPLSVIVVEPDQHSFQAALPSILEEMQKAMLSRFARVKLAQSMHHQLRLMDLILEEDGSQRFIILCPEVDHQGSTAIVERVQTVMEQANIAVHCSSATFPQEGLTFEGLVDQAKAKMSRRQQIDKESVDNFDVHPIT